MIKKFSVQNFRNVNIDNIEFNQINILIGPNNSGKTNFIKALSFFANMIIGGKDNSYDSAFLSEVDRNGWGKLFNKNEKETSEITFNWNIELDGEVCDYQFAFHTGQEIQQFFITKEELSVSDTPMKESRPFNYFKCHTDKKGVCIFSTAIKKGQPNKRVEMPVTNQDTVLLQFKDTLFEKNQIDDIKIIRTKLNPKFDQLLKYFKGFSSYSSAQFNLSAIRQPVETKLKGTSLYKDGSNFVNVFNNHKSKDLYFKVKFEESLKQLMPHITTTDISHEFEKLVFRMGYNYNQFDLSDVSDGTIKAMLLTLLLTLPEDSYSLMALDEPEMNMHPAWQKIIGKWILTQQSKRQYFISTHSPDFLDVFTDGFQAGQVGIFVFSDKPDQGIRKLSYDEIQDDLGDWQLGDLYRTNDPVIGGWPTW
ncbi:AAA family ATPase [Paenibacillus sp. sgz302251]|uniref:AAA family ATPase n=1 Tax=Paenibacillus sp. sgz302251 TaxID=3414493 RepID=UPI003C7AA07F